MNPKYYKCEICGDEVFKVYYKGKIQIREVVSRGDFNQTIPHTCSYYVQEASS